MGGRRKKRETYYDRWRREHPRIQLYLSREEYEWLKKLADEKGMSMKELILEAIRDAKKFYEEGEDDEADTSCDLFIEYPKDFYELVLDRAEKMGIKDFEPCLFTAPCSICGKPMIFTHKDKNYNEIRETLHEAFKYYYHVKCGKRLLEKLSKSS